MRSYSRWTIGNIVSQQHPFQVNRKILTLVPKILEKERTASILRRRGQGQYDWSLPICSRVQLRPSGASSALELLPCPRCPHHHLHRLGLILRLGPGVCMRQTL